MCVLKLAEQINPSPPAMWAGEQATGFSVKVKDTSNSLNQILRRPSLRVVFADAACPN